MPPEETTDKGSGGPILTEKYLEQIKDLPVMPEVAAKVVNLTEDRLEISFKELESIIKVDPGLTAKILKIANSALYARQKEIRSLQMAITLLGFKNIKSLVLLLTATNLFPRIRRTAFHHDYWRRSLHCAFLSRNLAVRCSRSEAAEEAFIAGLLHDIGQAVLFNAAPEQYLQALEAEKLGALSMETIEEQLFGVNHRQIGGTLLEKWNFPDLYADAARDHDTLNITSVHKPLVILISVAGIIAAAMDGEPVGEARREVFAQLLPYTCLGNADIPGLARDFTPQLAQDKLLQEFQGLLEGT
jgi:HD-like signal output (HDOD) protein